MIAMWLLVTEYVVSGGVLLLYTILFFGFAKYDRGGDPLVRNLARAMTVVVGTTLVGVATWVVLATLHTMFGETFIRLSPFVLLGVRAGYTLLVFALLFAAWFMFRFFQELIPAEDRAHWHLLMAPFYPKAKGLIVRRR